MYIYSFDKISFILKDVLLLVTTITHIKQSIITDSKCIIENEYEYNYNYSEILTFANVYLLYLFLLNMVTMSIKFCVTHKTNCGGVITGAGTASSCHSIICRIRIHLYLLIIDEKENENLPNSIFANTKRHIFYKYCIILENTLGFQNEKSLIFANLFVCTEKKKEKNTNNINS